MPPPQGPEIHYERMRIPGGGNASDRLQKPSEGPENMQIILLDVVNKLKSKTMYEQEQILKRLKHRYQMTDAWMDTLHDLIISETKDSNSWRAFTNVFGNGNAGTYDQSERLSMMVKSSSENGGFQDVLRCLQSLHTRISRLEQTSLS
jgi:hypothetical protein